MYCIGYDLGSSFVKAALVNIETGTAAALATYPDHEMSIESKQPGWAEQRPESWWEAVRRVTALLASRSPVPLSAAEAVGIAYQMHGLVLVDHDGAPVRASIIWCDSRAAGIGRKAFRQLGERDCLDTLLNSPGNFTASKLRWVFEHEPSVYSRSFKALLPGDYLALKMTGEFTTTIPGLSECILWNFRTNEVATSLLRHYDLRSDLLARAVPSVGTQGRMTAAAADDLGLRAGIPVSYRAGDQPNNAFALNVLEPGDIAATAGTSGVVYAVAGVPISDPLSRINAFAHVNHAPSVPRIGILLCINGTGIANTWMRTVSGGGGETYAAMDRIAATVPPGARGVSFLPFGNGAERMFGDRELGAHFLGLNFHAHGSAELFRAVQEGVAFALTRGIEIMASMDILPRVLRACSANMFRSPVFCSALADAADVRIELYNTDGAQGAARGAALGAGLVKDGASVFGGLNRITSVEPGPDREATRDAYRLWNGRLDALLSSSETPPGLASVST